MVLGGEQQHRSSSLSSIPMSEPTTFTTSSAFEMVGRSSGLTAWSLRPNSSAARTWHALASLTPWTSHSSE